MFGNRPILVPTAGAGGGYFFVGRLLLAIDAKSISHTNLYAEGRMDCAELQGYSSLIPGGFGGGGGACCQGGGGGGTLEDLLWPLDTTFLEKVVSHDHIMHHN